MATPHTHPHHLAASSQGHTGILETWHDDFPALRERGILHLASVGRAIPDGFGSCEHRCLPLPLARVEPEPCLRSKPSGEGAKKQLLVPGVVTGRVVIMYSWQLCPVVESERELFEGESSTAR